MPVLLVLGAHPLVIKSIAAELTKTGYHVLRNSSEVKGIQPLDKAAVDLLLAAQADTDHHPNGFGPVPVTAFIVDAPSLGDRAQESTVDLSDRERCETSTEERRLPGDVGSLSNTVMAVSPNSDLLVSHASERWAKAVVGIVGAAGDPRTLPEWGRCIAASPGAIRNWCCTVGLAPRRSLLLGRMLRALIVGARTGHSLVELLNVVDRRTLTKMIRLAGFSDEQTMPHDAAVFLEGQTLICNSVALEELKRALVMSQ